MASEEQENVCFCCYAEDSVFLCGCSCKTLHACGSCIWKLTSQQIGTQYWRTLGRQCKVCRQEYSDASVLAGCNHALQTVMALGCGTPERDSVQNDVLYMLIAFTDKTLAVTKARDILNEYERTLGSQNLSTALCKLNVAYVLSAFGEDEEAISKFCDVSVVQANMVQSWDWHDCTDMDRKWMWRFYCSRLNVVLCCRNIACLDKDSRLTEAVFGELQYLLQVFETLHEHSNTHPESATTAHDDYVFIHVALAEMLTNRVLCQVPDRCARTRAQNKLVVWAQTVVQKAHAVVLQVYGPGFSAMSTVENMLFVIMSEKTA